MPDPTVEREMHELRARLDAMETTQRCIVDTGDISEAESENEDGNEGEEVAVEDAAEERLFRVVARIGAREKMDIPVYEGNLDVEDILDWIRAQTNTSTMRMSRKTRKSNMSLLDLKGMQHYGGMNCRLTDVARASRKSRAGIEWLQK
jgi:hypothetical protein